VRHPRSHGVMRVHLIIRASQDGEVTAAHEVYEPDDGG